MTTLKVYYDEVFKCEAVKVLPGQFYVTDRDMLICTTLGSCVAACIRDRVSGIGGMNHFMLPYNNVEQNNLASESARYGVYAMELLLNQVIKMGAVRRNLEAKVFGGGNLSQNFTRLNIGDRNSNFVREYLRNEDIIITAEDLAHCQGRKVYFFPHTGKVLVQKLTIVASSILNVERDYAKTIKYDIPTGNIDLF